MAKTRPAASIPSSSQAPALQGLDLDAALLRAGRLLSDERALELSRLLDRWHARRFHALVVGEFKRGKSTLVNALIGEDLLPTGVPPVTAVLTRVRSGPERRALVRFRNGGQREIAIAEVRDFVDESRNAGNERNAARVDIEVPAGPPPGVVLVDVPGLGSVHQHNSETALAALPEADAALVVASVDPPVGEAELRLLSALRRHAARIEVVLNKIDYLDDEGRKAVLDFTRSALARAGFPEIPVWPVSARDGLRARLSRNDLAWRRSGMEALSEGLGRFFRQERTTVLARSVARKAGRLVEQESALVEMRRAAAEQSSEKLREIIGAFRARRATADRDAAETVMIFRRRFASIFAGYSERAAGAWKEPRGLLASRLREVVESHVARTCRAASDAMGAAVRDAVSAFLDRFLPEEQLRLAGAYAGLCAEVGRAAAERAEAVWRLAAEFIPFEPPRVEPPSAAPAPTLAALQLGSLHLLLDGLLDAAARLLPRGAALRRLAAQARDEAEACYGQAVEQSRETFSRAYEEHFGAALAAYDECARQTASAVDKALEAAQHRAQALEASRLAGGEAEELHRAELRELLALLRAIETEGEAPA